VVATCEEAFTTYDLNLATQALYQFLTAEFCDVYLEYSKAILKGGEGEAELKSGDGEGGREGEVHIKSGDREGEGGRVEMGVSPEEVQTVRNILRLTLDTSLRAIAPFMPFLAEELFQRLHYGPEALNINFNGTTVTSNTKIMSDTTPAPAVSVHVAPYPSPSSFPFRDSTTSTNSTNIEASYNLASHIIHSVLACRRNYALTKTRQTTYVRCLSPEAARSIPQFHTTIAVLSRSADVKYLGAEDKVPGGCVTCYQDEDVVVFVDLKVRTLCLYFYLME
jgi:valyl-tRNA synthetase